MTVDKRDFNEYLFLFPETEIAKCNIDPLVQNRQKAFNARVGNIARVVECTFLLPGKIAAPIRGVRILVAGCVHADPNHFNASIKL
jgi:hypothetical protein